MGRLAKEAEPMGIIRRYELCDDLLGACRFRFPGLKDSFWAVRPGSHNGWTDSGGAGQSCGVGTGVLRENCIMRLPHRQCSAESGGVLGVGHARLWRGVFSPAELTQVIQGSM
jgi:hypothetical protein